MKKLGIVFGVAALTAIVGCKDPNYLGPRTMHKEEAKDVETETPEEVKTEEAKTEEVKADEVKVEEAKAEEKKAEETKAAEPEYTIYIVQRNDSLSKISKKYNIKIDAIKKLNNMKSDVLMLGQKIKLPGKIDVGEQKVPEGAKAAPEKKAAKASKTYEPYTGDTEEYVVKSGDTLGAIAYGHGINIRQLKDLNSLKKDNVRVGQKLKVPVGKAEKKDAPTKETEKKVEAAPEPTVEAAPVVEEPVVETAPAPVVDEVAPETYVVLEGDDITGVSIRYGVSASAIREANNLGDDDQLVPGQVIKLPAEAQQ